MVSPLQAPSSPFLFWLWELTVTAVFLLSHSFRWWAPGTYGGSGISLGARNAKLLISCHVVCKGNLQKTTKDPRRGHFQLPQNWSRGPTTTDKEMLRDPKRLGPDTFPGAELALLPGTSPGAPAPALPYLCKKDEWRRGGIGCRWGVGEWVPLRLLPHPRERS